jgi:hypothetical protein
MVRQKIAERPEAAGKLPSIFPEDDTLTPCFYKQLHIIVLLCIATSFWVSQ